MTRSHIRLVSRADQLPQRAEDKAASENNCYSELIHLLNRLFGLNIVYKAI